MPELLTKDEPAATEAPEDELHTWAREHVAKVRRVKTHVAAYLVGMLLLTPLWALIEWADNGAFERLSFDEVGAQGTWEPWILFVGLIWGLIVAIEAAKTYFDRPTTEAEIDREVRRIQSRR